MKYLEWDTKFFGRPSYLIEGREDILTIDSIGKSFITAKVDMGDVDFIFDLQKKGFVFIDVEVSLKFHIKYSEIINYCRNIDCVVKSVKVNTGLPYLELGSAFHLTRFHMDPNIASGKANELWISYLRNFLPNENRKMYVTYLGEKAVGVILSTRQEGIAVISFMAVLPEYRGKGIGSQLIAYVVRDNNYEVITGTQSRNIPALNFYINNGFRIYKTKAVLHRWR
ncbi:MAG: hypothetical protein DRP84_08885 [Spirochaetes bacterium]|nr:MAG: hypothetical protein DRP84_08885 [Spirochaetota bacterium]